MDSKFVWGLVTGVGACAAVPVLRPLARALVRPVLKGAVRGGYEGMERSRVVWARLTEELEDVVAEVRSERDEALSETLAAKRRGEEAQETN